jgi:hypothetical protein
MGDEVRYIRIPTVSVLPTAGRKGRLRTLFSDLRLWVDNGQSWGVLLSTSSTEFRTFTDCIANVNSDQWTYTVSGTGAAFSSLAIAADNAVGILRGALGTVATNRFSIASPNVAVLLFGKGVARFVSRCRIPTLSTVLDTFTVRAGFIDSITAESTDGVFFRYTNGTAAGNFQAVTRNNGAETATDTLIPAVANTWYSFEIIINAAGTSAEFRINGVSVATNTLNIPTATGRETGYGVFVLRSLGIAAVNALDIDFVETIYNFSTAR